MVLPPTVPPRLRHSRPRSIKSDRIGFGYILPTESQAVETQSAPLSQNTLWPQWFPDSSEWPFHIDLSSDSVKESQTPHQNGPPKNRSPIQKRFSGTTCFCRF